MQTFHEIYTDFYWRKILFLTIQFGSKKSILYDFPPVAMCYNATILHLFFATKTTTKALRQAEIGNVLKY